MTPIEKPERLTCPRCRADMNWLDENIEKLKEPRFKGQIIVIARCPRCTHEVSLEAKRTILAVSDAR